MVLCGKAVNCDILHGIMFMIQGEKNCVINICGRGYKSVCYLNSMALMISAQIITGFFACLIRDGEAVAACEESLYFFFFSLAYSVIYFCFCYGSVKQPAAGFFQADKFVNYLLTAAKHRYYYIGIQKNVRHREAFSCGSLCAGFGYIPLNYSGLSGFSIFPRRNSRRSQNSAVYYGCKPCQGQRVLSRTWIDEAESLKRAVGAIALRKDIFAFVS